VTYGERDAQWERQRLSFGDCAATYDAARPEWPAATARWLTGTEDGGPLTGRGRLRVADVGAGTGKLTRTLVAAGHEVVAVDPSEGMLAALRAAVPGTPTFVGTGEQLPLPDASVDVVTVAQAWHWFDADAATFETARVLRPGGVLGIAWHVRDETVPWVRELTELTHPVLESDRVPAALPGPPGFTPLERETFRYEQRLTVEELVTLASSWSYVATRPDCERVLGEVRALGERAAAGRGVLVVPHHTRCYRARRVAS
jgi:ubiquinone/menaquinone biosynthesis C-methylase UbiE